MIIILGKSGSGKDLIVDELSKYGYQKLISYTTRPLRKGEKQDITYHYISETEFRRKINEQFFLEYKAFTTNCGTWYYGSAKVDYKNAKNNTISILAPEGYKTFLQEFPDKEHKSIYIFSNNETICKRLVLRGDKKEEILRRINNDNNDFLGIGSFVDCIVFNNQDNDITDVVSKIIMCIGDD